MTKHHRSLNVKIKCWCHRRDWKNTRSFIKHLGLIKDFDAGIITWKQIVDINNTKLNQKLLQKVFEYMIEQFQFGSIDRTDYDNGDELVEGYAQAITDGLDKLEELDIDKGFSDFIAEMRKEVESFK